MTPADINELLAVAYTETGIEIWWNAKNRHLGGRPVDVWKGGIEDRARVFAEAERVAGGSW
jgi:hypothetical protein